MSDIDIDIKTMSDTEFEKKYGKSKEQLQKDLKEAFNSERDEVKAILDKHGIKNSDDIDYGSDVYDELYNYFANSGEMPYGVMKARTGMPDEWIADRIYDLGILDEQGPSDMGMNKYGLSATKFGDKFKSYQHGKLTGEFDSMEELQKHQLELIKDDEIISSIMFEESFKVNFESWNNAGTNYYTELGIYNIRGENYFDGMISEMCKKEDIIVASINASKLISGEIIEGGFYSESDTTPVVMLALYKIENDKLVAFDKTIKDEEIHHNYNFFDCIDVNNDNKRDITASVFSQQWNDYDNNRGVPEIYINADDYYYNLDTSNWPTYSDNEDTQGYLFDIDMSGTLDLVIFPTKVNSSSKVEIYTTNKNLTD